MEGPSRQSRYWFETAAAPYSLLLALPFFLIYEIGLLGGGMLNFGDGALRRIINMLFAFGGPRGTGVLLAVLAGVFLYRMWQSWTSPPRYQWLVVMLAEAAGWVFAWEIFGLLFLGMKNNLFSFIPNPETLSRLEFMNIETPFAMVASFCGAGFFEELFFRVILLRAAYAQFTVGV